MDHADTMRGLYAALNAGDLDGFGATWPTISWNMRRRPGLRQRRPASWSSFVCTGRRSPTCIWEPQDVLASGDKVAARVRATGTHQGEFMGMPSSGKFAGDLAARPEHPA